MRVLSFAVFCLLSANVLAQSLYRYQDEQGRWHFTDRPPAQGETASDVARDALAPTRQAATVELTRQIDDDGVTITAVNTFHCPVQLVFEITDARNVPADLIDRYNVVLAADSRTRVLEVPRPPSGEVEFDIPYEFLPGDPEAVHDAGISYRAPFAISSEYTVTQAFPTRITHTTPASEHAIDFALPEGTAVYAARAGVVFDIAYQSFSGGTSQADMPKANVVRIVHDDGTLAVYAHLSWNSIRVRPGQRVTRGAYLADSGNTGFSSGPHLHFAVQRNAGQRIVSVPVTFAGPADAPVAAQTGATMTAY